MAQLSILISPIAFFPKFLVCSSQGVTREGPVPIPGAQKGQGGYKEQEGEGLAPSTLTCPGVMGSTSLPNWVQQTRGKSQGEGTWLSSLGSRQGH